MNQRELAANFLRYYSAPGHISDNGPPALRAWIAGLPRAVDRYMVHAALEVVAGRAQLPPDAKYIANWFASRPGSYTHCDTILGGKKPPQTYAELLDLAYKSAQQEAVDLTRRFVAQQLMKNL